MKLSPSMRKVFFSEYCHTRDRRRRHTRCLIPVLSKSEARSGKEKKVLMWKGQDIRGIVRPSDYSNFLLFILFIFLDFPLVSCFMFFRSEDLIPIPIPSKFYKNSSRIRQKFRQNSTWNRFLKWWIAKCAAKSIKRILKLCKNSRCKGLQISNLVELEKCWKMRLLSLS